MTFNWQVLLLLGAVQQSYGKSHDLVDEVTWKKIEYQFPTLDIRNQAIENGDYDPTKMYFPLDADIYYDDNNERTIFVTIPRVYDGIPITLGVVTDETADGGPEIRAFPNYETQDASGRDCDLFTSVYRIKIDSCGRLWAIDSGSIGREYGVSGYVQVCLPALWAFDVETGQVLVRHVFPEDHVRKNSLFMNLEVDVRNPNLLECDQTMVYVADSLGSGLIVYDLDRNVSWRIENEILRPDPDFEDFYIDGISFQLHVGVLGLAVYPPPPIYYGHRGHHHQSCFVERRLYFQGFSSDRLNYVALSVIDDPKEWKTNPEKFHVLGHRNSQSGPLAVNSKGRLYFGETPSSISSWSTHRKKYERSNIRVEKTQPSRLQFLSGTKIIRNKRGKESLLVVSNRIQIYYGGFYNSSETNFRIMSMKL